MNTPSRAATGFEPTRPAVDLTLFVACYNEAANIVATLDTVAAALAELDRTSEIIVVDDASRDGSASLIRDYARAHPELPLQLVVQPVNRGLARNFAAAARLGAGEYYKLVCGDNVESRATLLAILSRMGRADLVLPFHDACPGKSPFRLFLSRTFTRLVNVLTGRSIRYYNGLPLFRRADVLGCCSETVGFGFQAELVTTLLDRGVSYEEVRVEVVERAGGSSTALTWRNFRAVAGTLGRIGWRRLRGVLTSPLPPAPSPDRRGGGKRKKDEVRRRIRSSSVLHPSCSPLRSGEGSRSLEQ